MNFSTPHADLIVVEELKIENGKMQKKSLIYAELDFSIFQFAFYHATFVNPLEGRPIRLGDRNCSGRRDLEVLVLRD